MFPAVDVALLNWLRVLKADQAAIPTVEPQTISSILGASEKWSIIPARYILVEGRCNTADVDTDPWDASIYTPCGETACSSAVTLTVLVRPKRRLKHPVNPVLAGEMTNELMAAEVVVGLQSPRYTIPKWLAVDRMA
jgi:hypothetical protein